MLTKPQQDWLDDVLGLVTLMYHLSSLDHLYQVYQQGDEDLLLSQEDFEEAVREKLGTEELSPFVLEGRDVIASVLAKSENQISYVRTLREWFGQRKISPYLPSKEETMFLRGHGYRLSPTTETMQGLLTGAGLTQEAAEDVIREDSVMLWSGYSLEDAARQCIALAMNYVYPLHLSEETQKGLIDASAALLREVPQVTYLGYSIAQLEALQIGDIHELPLPPGWEKNYGKIYPNDPCPCGSGKKFKKCHGRKR